MDRVYLRTAPGLDANAPAILEIARKLPRGDLKQLVDGVTAFLSSYRGCLSTKHGPRLSDD